MGTLVSLLLDSGNSSIIIRKKLIVLSKIPFKILNILGIKYIHKKKVFIICVGSQYI